jgi:hypothetical protein
MRSYWRAPNTPPRTPNDESGEDAEQTQRDVNEVQRWHTNYNEAPFFNSLTEIAGWTGI